MVVSLTSCVLAKSLVLGKQIKEQKVQEREEFRRDERSAGGKLNVREVEEGSERHEVMHSRKQIASFKT